MSDANTNSQVLESRQESENDDRPLILHAALTPHRSMNRAGFVALMAVVGAICFGCGLLFASLGAWPVAGFLGLDVVLVWYAFRRSYAQARQFEEVSVSPDEVVLTKVAQGGARQIYRFNPYWARLNVTRIEDEGVTRLELTSHGRSVPLGAFLAPSERAGFASILARALAAARAGQAPDFR